MLDDAIGASDATRMKWVKQKGIWGDANEVGKM